MMNKLFAAMIVFVGAVTLAVPVISLWNEPTINESLTQIRQTKTTTAAVADNSEP